MPSVEPSAVYPAVPATSVKSATPTNNVFVSPIVLEKSVATMVAVDFVDCVRKAKAATKMEIVSTWAVSPTVRARSVVMMVVAVTVACVASETPARLKDSVLRLIAATHPPTPVVRSRKWKIAFVH